MEEHNLCNQTEVATSLANSAGPYYTSNSNSLSDAPLPSISSILRKDTKPDSLYYCDRCDKNFNSEESLKIHCDYHTDNLVNMWMSPEENREQELSQMPQTSQSLSAGVSGCNTLIPEGDIAVVKEENPIELLTGEVSADFNLNPSSISSALEPLHISSGNYSGHSPLDYEFNTSPGIHSPHAQSNNIVQPGPSSSHSSVGYPQQSPKHYYTDFTTGIPQGPALPQQSPVMGQQPSPVVQNNQYGYPAGGSQGSSYEDYFGNTRTQNQSLQRFHPYTRSPAASPTIVKEEAKSTSDNVILDLDSQQRFVGNGNRAALPQLSGGNTPQQPATGVPPIWNPMNQHPQASNLVPDASNAMRLPGQGTIQHVNSSMYAGSTMSGMIPQGFASPSTSYHPQGFPTTVASPSPSYISQNSTVSSTSRQAVNARANGDLPPTDCPSNVKRAKNFKCETCRKWFTSQGHLKRHYGTTLHKNMEKQEENKKSAETSSSTLVNSIVQQPLSSSQDHQQRNSTISPMGLTSQVLSPTPPVLTSDSAVSQTQDTSSLHTPSSANDTSAAVPHYQVPAYSSHDMSLHASQIVSSASSSFSSVPSFQPQYSQAHQFSQIQHQQTQYMNSSIQHQQLGSMNNVSSSYPNSSFNTSHPTHTQQHSQNASSAFFHSGSTPMSGGGYQETSYSAPNSTSPHHHQQSPPIVSGNTSNQLGFHPSQEFPELDSIKLEQDELNSHSVTSYMNLNPSPPQERPSSELSSATESPEASQDSPASTQSHESNPDSKYECSDCGKRFAKVCYLTQHRSNYHDGVKPFKCEKCGKRFTDLTTFEEHKSKHTGNKPFKCKECPKQFNHKTDLRRHNCLHTGEKPFACSICQKGFIRKDHMMKHMQTHKKKQAAIANASNIPNTLITNIVPPHNSLSPFTLPHHMPASSVPSLPPSMSPHSSHGPGPLPPLPPYGSTLHPLSGHMGSLSDHHLSHHSSMAPLPPHGGAHHSGPAVPPVY